MSLMIRWFTVWFLTFALAVVAIAQPKQTTWTAELSPKDVRPGESAQILLKAKIESGWHIYGFKEQKDGPVPTALELDEESAKGRVALNGKPIEPTPGRKQDQNFGIEVDYHEGNVTFAIPIQVDPNAEQSFSIKVNATSQACNDSTCARPATEIISVPIKLAAGKARPDRTAPILALAGVKIDSKSIQLPKGTKEVPGLGEIVDKQVGTKQPAAGSNTPAQDATVTKVQQAKAQGILSFAWLAFSAGLLALLTPCVFPMIPITVSFFTKKSGEQQKDVRGAAAYCLGIIVSFTGVGLLVTLLFGASGLQKLATNPIVNLLLAGLFIVLALSLFGVYELALPSGLVNRFGSASRGKSGLVGPILMGVTFSLTTFTCTVPFVGTLLLAATQGDFWYPLVGMLAFSSAFALPFFVLAMFPQYLAKLPRSGSWLATVKAFMGFLELAAALKFLSNIDLVYGWGIITRPVFLSIWATLMVLAALYLFGSFLFAHDATKTKIGWVRRVFAVASLGAAWICLAGLNGRNLGDLGAFLPPDPYPGAKVSSLGAAEELSWHDDYKTALAEAKSSGRPLFIDFTGVTCTNCRQMEQQIFPLGAVKAELEKMVRVKLYTDRPGDQFNVDLQTKLTQSSTLPVYVVLNATNEQPAAIFGGSTRDAEKYVAFLKDGIATVSPVASR